MGDSVLRAITEDGAFRVITAITTDTVQGVLSAQHASGDLAVALGDLVTGAILVRETMAPGLRVQGILKAKDQAALVADSHPDGSTRGLLQRASLGLRLGGAVLQVMRTLPNGALHQGYVELPESSDVSRGLMEYMQQSEQVESVVSVATIVTGGVVTAAAGFVVQLLPEADASALGVMTARLAALPPTAELLRAGVAGVKGLLGQILVDTPHATLEETPLRFGCQCSDDRVLASLSTLPKSELQAMRDEHRGFEISCDFCGTDYRIEHEALNALLTVN